MVWYCPRLLRSESTSSKIQFGLSRKLSPVGCKKGTLKFCLLGSLFGRDLGTLVGRLLITRGRCIFTVPGECLVRRISASTSLPNIFACPTFSVHVKYQDPGMPSDSPPTSGEFNWASTSAPSRILPNQLNSMDCAITEHMDGHVTLKMTEFIVECKNSIYWWGCPSDSPSLFRLSLSAISLFSQVVSGERHEFWHEGWGAKNFG